MKLRYTILVSHSQY